MFKHREKIMRNSISNAGRVSVACALALGAASFGASAQAPLSAAVAAGNERGLLLNSSGQVWMNSFGECWRSSYGPAPAPNAACGPLPVAQYIAPVAAAEPRPAPAAPVALAPAAPAAPQPVYEKLALNTNVLFDFDASTLRPAGRDSLDELVARMKGAESGSITAIGYADRFGSDDYNQALSESRVAAVKAYLVEKGIEASWVQSSAKGETQPTTRTGECAGGKSTGTIACLQPDRHVSVEMTGSRPK
jgi:OOP family OmpA-OmpF porin